MDATVCAALLGPEGLGAGTHALGLAMSVPFDLAPPAVAVAGVLLPG